MRPVNKWQPNNAAIQPPIQAQYIPYSSAKNDLERNIGPYCSYCEKRIEDEALHVEHIQCKSLPQYAHLRYSWDNFLLSCQRCNGPDNKGTKNVILNSLHLPHLNNTYHSIMYDYGIIWVNSALPAIELAKAEALIDLVGLNKLPGDLNYKIGDKRWQRRFEIWDIANRNLDKLVNGQTNVDNIVELALGVGFWSVWMKVFENHNNVRSALIKAFPNTYPNCVTSDVNRIP